MSAIIAAPKMRLSRHCAVAALRKNTSVLNDGAAYFSQRTQARRLLMAAGQYLHTDREAADLCCTAWRAWTTACLDADHM
ncbi:MAG: hypothetical protein ACLVFC_07045 [Subdoligranulum sp.]